MGRLELEEEKQPEAEVEDEQRFLVFLVHDYVQCSGP